MQAANDRHHIFPGHCEICKCNCLTTNGAGDLNKLVREAQNLRDAAQQREAELPVGGAVADWNAHTIAARDCLCSQGLSNPVMQRTFGNTVYFVICGKCLS